MKNPLSGIEITRTPETEHRYRALVQSLLRKSHASQLILTAWPLADTSIVDRFIAFVYQLYECQSKSSRLSVIAALRYCFTEVQPCKEVVDRLPHLAASWPEPGPLPLRTSAQKLTSLRQSEFLRLSKELMRQREIGRQTLLCMICTGLTALRPKEWFGTRIVRTEENGHVELWLVVPNAKYSNGRSFAAQRRLNITDVGALELKCLQKFVAIVEEYGSLDDFLRFVNRIRASLRRANHAAFPRRFYKLHVPRGDKRGSRAGKHPTIYTMRHVVAAALKASGRTRREVAAILGHGSTYTAARHYARTTSQSAIQLGVRAHAADAALVRDNFVPFRNMSPSESSGMLL